MRKILKQFKKSKEIVKRGEIFAEPIKNSNKLKLKTLIISIVFSLGFFVKDNLQKNYRYVNYENSINITYIANIYNKNKNGSELIHSDTLRVFIEDKNDLEGIKKALEKINLFMLTNKAVLNYRGNLLIISMFSRIGLDYKTRFLVIYPNKKVSIGKT